MQDFTEELFIAISQNDFESIKECLAKGADINAIDEDRDVLSAAIASTSNIPSRKALLVLTKNLKERSAITKALLISPPLTGF